MMQHAATHAAPEIGGSVGLMLACMDDDNNGAQITDEVVNK
jgi:hypothetical protein